jgi:hypothetical protein
MNRNYLDIREARNMTIASLRVYNEPPGGPRSRYCIYRWHANLYRS